MHVCMYVSMNVCKLNCEMKRCPKCNQAIEKVSGCNHMVCATCGVHFCWRCLEQISGYDHFNRVGAQCGLFEVGGGGAVNEAQQEELEELAEDLQLPRNAPDVDDLIVQCSECGEQNAKVADPNTCVCPNCLYEYCFICGQPTFGGAHFLQSPCPISTPVNLVPQVRRQMYALNIGPAIA